MRIPSGPDEDKTHDTYVHQIKSKFTVIKGTTQLLERKIRSGQELSPEQMLAMLARIRQHADAAHDLVHAFHLFHWRRRRPPEE